MKTIWWRFELQFVIFGPRSELELFRSASLIKSGCIGSTALLYINASLRIRMRILRIQVNFKNSKAQNELFFFFIKNIRRLQYTDDWIKTTFYTFSFILLKVFVFLQKVHELAVIFMRFRCLGSGSSWAKSCVSRSSPLL